MRTTDDFFGKRPNWVLELPSMYGNPYNQAIYTHLRGMNPKTIWKSERALARTVADQTGFTEASCRKALTTLRTTLLISFNDDGTIQFNTKEVVTGVATLATGVTKTGYRGNHETALEQGVCGTRDNREVDSSKNGTGTNVPVPLPAGYKVNVEEPMLLGADPEQKPASDTKPNKAVPAATQVRDHFNLVARKVGANPVSGSRDVVAFTANIKRFLQAGYTAHSLMAMIDAFFQFDRNREHIAPWKLFVMKDNIRSLTSRSGAASPTSDVLGWIANDFTRSQDLPWDVGFDDGFQKLVQRRGIEVAYRYPDMLASIASASSGDLVAASSMLNLASDLIANCLSGNTREIQPLIASLHDHGVQVPKDLTPTRIRKAAMTLKEAVLFVGTAA